jgi:hypothetical protein
MIDKILTCNRNTLQKHLIFWRGNQFGRGYDRLCLCLEPFQQSHMISCAHLIDGDQPNILELITLEDWTELEVIFDTWWSITDAKNATI